MARKKRGGGAATRRDVRQLTFDPDPGRVLSAVDHLATILDTRQPIAPGVFPSHVFRVLRPADLCVFDVRGYRLRLETDEAGPVLVPDAADARLEVSLSFQHLGERAFFRSSPPPGPNPGDEPTDPPPIQALAARPSRLVFEVPDGETIGYSVAGVLAAISRLPLRVAPLATPRAITLSPDLFVPGAFTHVTTLAGGFQLVRHTDGLLTVISTDAAPATGTAPSARSLMSQAQALRTARVVLAGENAVDLSARRSLSGPLGRRPTPASERPARLARARRSVRGPAHFRRAG